MSRGDALYGLLYGGQTKMDAREIAEFVEAELGRSDGLENLHGITKANVRQFLVTPYEVTVDPDDGESAPRRMWVVLHERAPVRGAYAVVLNPADLTWGVVEWTDSGERLTMVVAAATLFEALEGM